MTKEEQYLKDNYFITWLAIKHHKTHKDKMIDFVNYPFVKQIYMDQSDKSIMKSTQCGISEMFVAEAIGNSILGRSIFYVLPTYDLVGRFVKNRMDKSIDFSPYYKNIVKNSSSGKSDAISLKHIGKGSIAFVGSNTPKPFTEYPADMVIIDELDQCDQTNIQMAWERMSASEMRRMIKTSQPTVLGFGIHQDWLESCQYTWHVECEHCTNEIQPDFFTHVVKQTGDNDYVLCDRNYEWGSSADIQLICEKCEKPFNSRKDGRWIAQKSGKSAYHISKLFTTHVSVVELVERFNKGLLDTAILQRFYNGDLGVPYTAAGAKIDKEGLDRCKAEYVMGANVLGSCVIGIDVGTMFHVRINKICADGRLQAVYIGSVKDENDINDLFDKYSIVAGVIDALPERRVSERLCRRHKGLFRCFYGDIKTDTIDMIKKTITVDRTAALDNVAAMILGRNLLLPINADMISEYYDHMQASTRLFMQSINKGAGGYRWIESTPDHFFHAEGYALLAKNLSISMVNK